MRMKMNSIFFTFVSVFFVFSTVLNAYVHAQCVCQGADATATKSIVALIGRNTDITTLHNSCSNSSFLKSLLQTHTGYECGCGSGSVVEESTGAELLQFGAFNSLLIIPPALDSVASSTDANRPPIDDISILSFVVSVADIILFVADDIIRQTDVEFLSALAVQKHHLGIEHKQMLVLTMISTRQLSGSQHQWHDPITAIRNAHGQVRHDQLQINSAFDVRTLQKLCDLSQENFAGLLRSHSGRLNIQDSVSFIKHKFSHFMLNSDDMKPIAGLQSRAIHFHKASALDDLSHLIDSNLLEFIDRVSDASNDRLLKALEDKCNSTRKIVMNSKLSSSDEKFLLDRIDHHMVEFRLAYFELVNNHTSTVNRIQRYVMNVYFEHAALPFGSSPRFSWCNFTGSASSESDELISAYQCAVNTLLALQLQPAQREAILFDVELIDHYNNLFRGYQSVHAEVAAGDYILQLTSGLNLLFSVGYNKSQAISYLLDEVEREGKASNMPAKEIEVISTKFVEHTRYIEKPPPEQMMIIFGHAAAKRNILRTVAAVVASVVVTVFMPGALGAALPALSAFQTAALTGALASTCSGLVSKEKDLISGATRGFILGGAASFIGDALPVLDAHKAFDVGNAAIRVGLESAVGCTASEVTGGKCKHGALQGAVSEISSSVRVGLGVESGLTSSLISGTAGGVVAERSGGSFEDGFVQGVIIDQLNHAAHQFRETISTSEVTPTAPTNLLDDSISELTERIDDLASRQNDLSFMEHLEIHDMHESLDNLYAIKYSDMYMEGVLTGTEIVLEVADLALNVIPAAKVVGDIPVKLAKNVVRKVSRPRPEKVKFLNSVPENSKVTLLNRGGGAVKHNGVDYYNVRELDHMSKPALLKMRKDGTNPVDKFGEKLVYHHHKQLDHRDPNGRLIELPKSLHKLGHKKLHPTPRKGLTPEVRKDYRRERLRFNRARAKIELTKRNTK